MTDYKAGFDNVAQTTQPQGYGQPQQGYGQPQQGYGQPQHQSSAHTTVIINQQAQPKGKRPWRSGICAICDDIPVCLLSTCFPTCYGCHLVTQADEHCCLACCCQGWLLPLRSYVRGRLGIEGSVFKDFFAIIFCAPCVTCQVARELKESKASGEWFTT